MKYSVPVLALALALTVPMQSSASTYDVSTTYSVSLPITVYTFVSDGQLPLTTRYGPYTLTSGTSGTYLSTKTGNSGGYTVVLPPSDTDGYYILSGTYVSTSGGYTNLPGYYFVDSNIDYYYGGQASSSNQPLYFSSTFNGVLYLPSHPSTLYLHLFISNHDYSYSTSYDSFGVKYDNPSLTFYPSTSLTPDYTSLLNQVISGIASLESALSKIEQATTQLSPMGQFEADYLDHYQDQLQGVEGALSGDSSSPLGGLAPNGGDYVGFAEDLTDGFGFSSSHFSSSQFSEAVNSLSGSDAFDVGGPWEFFSQSIADALAGQGSSTYSMPGLPPDDFISDWVRDSELRRARW